MQTLQALILLAALVTCCVTDESVEPHIACVDHSIPKSLQNETVSKLLKQYKDYLTATNATEMWCKEISILGIFSHAVNATGNVTETLSRLGINRIGCKSYFKFTLEEVALQNLKDPESFPGNTTVKELVDNVLITNTTENVLKHTKSVIKALKNKNIAVNKTIHELIEMGHFTEQSRFGLIMCFAIKASNLTQTSMELKFPKDLLDLSMIEMAELLHTSVRSFQKEISLECAIRHLQSAKKWLMAFRQFRMLVRMAVQNKTVDDLFKEKGLNKANTTVFALLEAVFNPQGLNMTFLTFFGPRRVKLDAFKFTVADLAKMTFVSSGAICNYTIAELFDFAFMYHQIFVQYKINTALAMSRRDMILKRYNATMADLAMAPFNLTSSATERELENKAIQFYLLKYAEHQKVNLTTLEQLSNITAGTLTKATVDNFVELLYKIAKANAFRVLLKEKAFHKIVVDTSSISFVNLKEQIQKEWSPITTDLSKLSTLALSYIIFQEKVNPTEAYNKTFYDFVRAYLPPMGTSFKDLLKIYDLHQSENVLETEFKKFKIMEFNKFLGFKRFEIFSWTVKDFLKKISAKILSNINECKKPQPCANGATCKDHPFGFTCICPPNKNLDANKMCADIDECKQKPLPNCGKNSKCVNTIGSYMCKCNIGFAKNTTTKMCEDIDECKRDHPNICNGAANVNCTNTIGSYRCDCKRGFRYNRAYDNCVEINVCKEQKPCDSIRHSRCEQASPGSYKCLCRSGFKKVSNDTHFNCTDINECVNNDTHNCHKHAKCNNNDGSYTCTCKDGYKGNGFACKVVRLFKIWEIRSIKLRKFYARIKLRAKMYYNGKMHRKLYVTEDGFISIGKRVRGSAPRQLKTLNRNVLAPFWAWTNYIFDSSSVTYYELVKGDEAAASLLNKVNMFVVNSTNDTSFDTKYAIVITWTKMTPFWWGRRFYPSPYAQEQNTFQAVIAIDGGKTVVIFIYEDGGMKWRGNYGRDATVGYSGFQVDGSFTDKIFTIDQQTFTDPAGQKRTGILVWLFQDKQVTPEDKCLNWITKQPATNQGWLDRLPDCPCTLNQMRWSWRFRQWNKRIGCYISWRNDKSCCYDSSGALVTSPYSRAGRAHSGPNDASAFEWCCIESDRYCGDFSLLRPADEGCNTDDEPQECGCINWLFNFRPRPRRRRRLRFRARRSFMWGDPHISTFDGFKYTFNGLGDYVLLKTTDSGDFNAIHTRTKQPKDLKTGTPANATVFSGFAMRSSKNTTVQVFFDANMPGNLSITTVNKSMNCNPFGISDLAEHPIDGFILSNSSDTLVVLYDSGLTVEITPGLELLQFALNIPSSNFVNRTAGLLGTLNENQNDDLTRRNGTTVSIKSSDKEIFEYGKGWLVQAQERLFVNSTCDKKPVFTSNFIPYFLSDLQANITEEMRTTCNNNTECLLDYFATGNKEFALATLKFETENEKIKKIFDNRPPSITLSPKVIRATAGQEIRVNVTVTDPDNDTIAMFMVQGLPEKNAMFTNTTPSGVFTWTPAVGLKKVTITFVAKDSKGAAAAISPAIRYCDCKNNNTCDFETIEESYANSSLQLVGCNCTEQYTGDQCETEVNPCEEGACYTNVSCTVTRNPFGHKCGPCPEGREGNGKVCNDFDECINSSRNNCNETEKCVNTIGSFRCDCKPGFSRDEKTKQCVDINECHKEFEDNYKCKGNTSCNNFDGSYNCTCKKGFKGDPLKGCSDINECKGEDKICYGQKCENSPGSFKCTCSAGYELKKDKNNNNLFCKDIDECKYPSDNNCTQVCVNNRGSYTCTCKSGFQLDGDGYSCKVKNENMCGSTKGGCEKLCTNSSGTVTCHCPRGFNLSSNGKTCDDVNECMTSNGGCSQKCNNYIGTYNCSCRSGYELKGARMCEDINECSTNNGGCGQMCLNKPGGHDCKCKKGRYILKTSDNRTCEDINECKNNAHNCGKHRECNNVPGGYRCRCKDRRMFSNGKQKCRKSRRFRFFFVLIVTWKNDYDDEFSEKSVALKDWIVKLLNAFFTRKFQGGYLGCRVMKFKRGSVQVNVTLNFDSNSNVTASDVNNAVANVSDIGGLKVNATTSKVSDMNECNDPSLNNCHKDATCKDETGTFSCICKDGYEGDGFNCAAIPKKKDDDKIMIILLCTLIPLAVILIIILIFCCYKRRGKGNLKMDDGSNGTYQLRNRDNDYESSQRQVHYDNARKGSDDSTGAGYYDISTPAGNNQSQSGMYDVSQAQYYDNPAVSTESKKI